MLDARDRQLAGAGLGDGRQEQLRDVGAGGVVPAVGGRGGVGVVLGRGLLAGAAGVLYGFS